MEMKEMFVRYLMEHMDAVKASDVVNVLETEGIRLVNHMLKAAAYRIYDTADNPKRLKSIFEIGDVIVLNRLIEHLCQDTPLCDAFVLYREHLMHMAYLRLHGRLE